MTLARQALPGVGDLPTLKSRRDGREQFTLRASIILRDLDTG